MSFTKTLLAGAALAALCTAPALARTAPPIHLVHGDTALKMKPGSNGHFKTSTRAEPNASFTTTVSFTGTLSTAAFRKVPTLLFAESWVANTCIPPTNEKGMFRQTTPAAKISNGSVTGTTTNCPSTTFTFYGPVYKLLSKTATSDAFTGTVIAKHYSGYNLTLIANTSLTITP